MLISLAAYKLKHDNNIRQEDFNFFEIFKKNMKIILNNFENELKLNLENEKKQNQENKLNSKLSINSEENLSNYIDLSSKISSTDIQENNFYEKKTILINYGKVGINFYI